MGLRPHRILYGAGHRSLRDLWRSPAYHGAEQRQNDKRLATEKPQNDERLAAQKLYRDTLREADKRRSSRRSSLRAEKSIGFVDTPEHA